MDTVSFELTGGVLEIDAGALEEIRAAVIAYLRDPDDAFTAEYGQMRDQFLQELESESLAIDFKGTARVDQWILQETLDRSGISLVRQPPRTPVMYLFHADIERSDSGDWTVSAFGHTRVFQ